MLNSVVSRALIHCLSVSQLSHVPLCALMFRLVYWCAACVLWCSTVCTELMRHLVHWRSNHVLICSGDLVCSQPVCTHSFNVVNWCWFAIPWTCQTPQQYCPTSPSSWFPVGRNFLSHAEVSLADLWHVMTRWAYFVGRLLASVIEVGVTVTHWKPLWASLRQSTVPLNWLEDSSSSIYGTVHAAHLGRILSTDWWMTIWFDSTKLLH